MATTSKLVSTVARVTRTGQEVVSTYYVSIDSPMVAQKVILAAQGVSTGDPVPPMNFSFSVTVGQLESDPSIFVEEITATPRNENVETRLKWLIVVTYRSPTLDGQTQRESDAGTPPLERDPEFWVEALVETRERDTGYNLQEMRWPWPTGGFRNPDPPEVRKFSATGDEFNAIGGELGPVSNAAGFRYGPVPTIQHRIPVFVYKRNVLNPFAWINIENQFHKAVNSTAWNVFGQYNVRRRISASQTIVGVSPLTCLFLSVETSRPKYYNDLRYYELEVRVLYRPEGHDIVVPNIGDKYWAKDSKGKFTIDIPHAAGQPMQPPVYLDKDGGLRETTGEPDEMKFRDTRARNFYTLNTLLASLT